MGDYDFYIESTTSSHGRAMWSIRREGKFVATVTSVGTALSLAVELAVIAAEGTQVHFRADDSAAWRTVWHRGSVARFDTIDAQSLLILVGS